MPSAGPGIIRWIIGKTGSNGNQIHKLEVDGPSPSGHSICPSSNTGKTRTVSKKLYFSIS
jgi:hypothetical protein